MEKELLGGWFRANKKESKRLIKTKKCQELHLINY